MRGIHSDSIQRFCHLTDKIIDPIMILGCTAMIVTSCVICTRHLRLRGCHGSSGRGQQAITLPWGARRTSFLGNWFFFSSAQMSLWKWWNCRRWLQRNLRSGFQAQYGRLGRSWTQDSNIKGSSSIKNPCKDHELRTSGVSCLEGN